MGETNACRTVAIRYSFLVEKNRKTKKISVRHVADTVWEVIQEAPAETVEQEDFQFKDDVTFLRSLDPKAWKDQDHYAVLGIEELRINATDDIIKTAYRKKVLKHHPDKRKAQGEEIRTDDDYFTCITRAYEILGNPTKRKSYDSVDPFFDNSLPTSSEIKSNFYKTFSHYFDLNSRWSEKRDVPPLGDESTSRDQVERFYAFWYNFESWREFSYLDEEEKEKGQAREERRWIEKQNKAARAKLKKEEMARIRSLVDMAYAADPRVARFKKEDKERKQAAKDAKLSAAKAKKEEEERLERERKEAERLVGLREKAEAEKRRQEREEAKKALKKERKLLRDFVKENKYFGGDSLQNMTALEKLCELLPAEGLAEVRLGGEEGFKRAVQEMEEKLEAERRENAAKSSAPKHPEASKPSSEWSRDDLQLLVKAVNLFPAGTNQRWQVIANFLNQHANSTRFVPKDVLAKAKSLQSSDFSRSNLKAEANDNAFNNFEREHHGKKAVQPQPAGEEPWTAAEQQLLEQALKTFPSVTPDRWDRIAECIPQRNKKECIRRYKALVEIVKAKKAAQEAAAKNGRPNTNT